MHVVPLLKTSYTYAHPARPQSKPLMAASLSWHLGLRCLHARCTCTLKFTHIPPYTPALVQPGHQARPKGCRSAPPLRPQMCARPLHQYLVKNTHPHALIHTCTRPARPLSETRRLPAYPATSAPGHLARWQSAGPAPAAGGSPPQTARMRMQLQGGGGRKTLTGSVHTGRGIISTSAWQRPSLRHGK